MTTLFILLTFISGGLIGFTIRAYLKVKPSKLSGYEIYSKLPKELRDRLAKELDKDRNNIFLTNLYLTNLLNKEYSSTEEFLCNIIDFEKSSEGFDYWKNISRKYEQL
jgi:hypothetical protein